ncbi:MAG TPA: protein kinase [Candidatus Acidoferrum sp.]|nr:protein kinase [Candidatus Acidoferrum sp.]
MDPIVSHYRIIEKIGEGGMGVVYRAHDDRLNRDVALKFLPAEFGDDLSARGRLIREARTASALNHPNICTIYDVCEEGGQTYLVMEFVKGRPLAEQIREGGLPKETVIRYAGQISDALSHAHQHGIVHRDLKSSNVIITPEGRAKVLDFGLAKGIARAEIGAKTLSLESRSDERTVAGTLPYIAPEVFRGEPADARSDIWSLGVVLYEMAVGHRPFRGRTAYDLSSAILQGSPEPLPTNVSPGLRTVMERCLAKEPSGRYQHASEVRAALETLASSAVIPPLNGTVHEGRATSSRGRRQWLVSVVVFGLLLVVLVVGLVVGKQFAMKRRPTGSVVAPIRSLAVLPLDNLSDDPKQDYFADGMSDALITDLSQIKELRVISRTSVMQYRGVHLPVSQIAKELRVDAVVEGSVLRSDDRVRISAELVRGDTQQNLWAQSYERPFIDVLSLQNDVARDIVDQIQIRLTQQEQARLATSRPVVPAAYDAYLQGRYESAQRTGEALSQSVSDYQHAIQLDPTYAPAYAGLAGALAVLPDYKDVPPAPVLRDAEAAAQKALQLDDGLAQAHAALGLIQESRLDWAAVLAQFQRAIELSPGDANAHHWNALALSVAGKNEQAIAEIRLAQELDPRSLIINANVAWCFYLAGKYDESIEQARRTLDLDPNFPVAHGYLGQAYLEKGKFEEAFQELRKALSLSGDETSYKAELANAYAVAGRKQAARAILGELVALSTKQYVSSYNLALVYAGLGDKDQTLEWLNKAYEEEAIRVININVHPRFASLRSDPRFEALVRRMGL